MPHTKSAKKHLHQDQRRAARNSRRVARTKELTRQIRDLVAAKKNAEALKLLPDLYQALDKAAKTHAIHKNAAGRKKSRLTKLVNAGGAKMPAKVETKMVKSSKVSR